MERMARAEMAGALAVGVHVNGAGLVIQLLEEGKVNLWNSCRLKLKGSLKP